MPEATASGSRTPRNYAIEVVQAIAPASSKDLREMREEHRLTVFFKSELDALENKLSRQMASFRGQLQSQNELIVEAFLNPIEAKVNALEGRERKLDCQMSDVRGEVKGLMDEVQLQIRRSDKVDAKIRSWRKSTEESYMKLEEELTSKLTAMIGRPVSAEEHRASQVMFQAELSRATQKLRQEIHEEASTTATTQSIEVTSSSTAMDSLTLRFEKLRLEQEAMSKQLVTDIANVAQQVSLERQRTQSKVDESCGRLKTIEASFGILQESKNDDILAAVKRYCDAMFDERLEQVKFASASVVPVDSSAVAVSDHSSNLAVSPYNTSYKESKRDEILADVKRYCDAMLDERLEQVKLASASLKYDDSKSAELLKLVASSQQESKNDEMLADVKRYCDAMFDERLEQVKLASVSPKHDDSKSAEFFNLVASSQKDLEERVKLLELEVASWRDRAPVGAAEPTVMELREQASVTPLRQVPRLDLSLAKNEFTPDSQPIAAWADGTSPDPSTLTQSDVAAIASVVQDKVWRQCKDHFERVVQAQASEVSVIEELRADSIRAYQMIDELVSIVTGGVGLSGGEDADGDLTDRREADAVQSRSAAQDLSCAQLAEMMKFELSKLWRVLLRLLDHVELSAMRKDSAEVSENVAGPPSSIRTSREEDSKARLGQDRLCKQVDRVLPQAPPERSTIRVDDFEGQPECAHPAAETALLQPSSRIGVEETSARSGKAVVQPYTVSNLESPSHKVLEEKTLVQPYSMIEAVVKESHSHKVLEEKTIVQSYSMTEAVVKESPSHKVLEEKALVQPYSMTEAVVKEVPPVMSSERAVEAYQVQNIQVSGHDRNITERTIAQPYSMTEVVLKDESENNMGVGLYVGTDFDPEDTTKESLEDAFSILRKSNEAIYFAVDDYVRQSKEMREMYALSLAMQCASEEQYIEPRSATNVAYASSVPQAVGNVVRPHEDQPHELLSRDVTDLIHQAQTY